MSQLIINGIESPRIFFPEQKLGDLLQQLRGELNSESSLITRLKVDGVDISENNEGRLERIPLSELNRIEVFTSHPKAFAKETLTTISDLLEVMILMCKRCGDPIKPRELDREVRRILDGLDVLAQTVDAVKKTLSTSVSTEVKVLEVDLFSILQDTEEAFKSKNASFLKELLSVHLVENLDGWRKQAIPYFLSCS